VRCSPATSTSTGGRSGEPSSCRTAGSRSPASARRGRPTRSRR
jgi:hypothetical protein